MPNRRDVFRAQMMDAVGELNKALAERKRKREHDAIAAQMASQYPEFQGVDSMDELNARLKLDEAMSQRMHRDAMTQRALREPVSNRGYRGRPLVDTPFGPMTAAEWAREQRAATTPRKSGSNDPVAKIERELNEELIAAGGMTLQDVPKLKNQRLVNPDGSPYNEEDAELGGSPLFAADLPQADGTTRTIKVPREKYETFRNQYDGLNRLREQSQRDDGTSKAAQIYMQQTRPGVMPQAEAGEGVIVQDTEGKRYRVSPEKAAAAEAAGYTRVR